MMRKSSKIYIEDILDAIEKIERYTGSQTLETFSKNEMIVDAVLRNIEIIGEAAKNIPEQVKKKFPDIPWKRMIGLRNIVSHEYFGVDLTIIWEIVRKDLPAIVPKVKTMLSNNDL